MRLLYCDDQGEIRLTPDLAKDERPPYAILSHTWGTDDEEVTFTEVETDAGQKKPGFEKIKFCAAQAKKDGIEHFWVDTCCINKANNSELSEAITSMFRWYNEAKICYVYLSDVATSSKRNHAGEVKSDWQSAFRESRWFSRGWTLQEMLAPKVVEFFSRDGVSLGDREKIANQIHKITSIPLGALSGASLSSFSIAERMRWAQLRQTKKPEDQAYCLLGIFDVSMSVIYGEGKEKAFRRLRKEIQDEPGATKPTQNYWIVPRQANPSFVGRNDLLNDLEETVRDAIYCPWGRDQCQIVISGIGGQGKSELSLQLAQRLRHLLGAVFWIDVSTPDIAQRSFSEIAAKVSSPVQNWQDARDMISNLQYPWLLILDNADDPSVDYQQYFPNHRQGVVLMTTRNEDCQQYGTDQSVSLEGLELNEAEDLLLKTARLSHKDRHNYTEAARRVVTLLHSHPLALISAGVYVARGYCTLSDYPNIYERKRKKLLSFSPSQARPRYGNVYTTFEVSINMLGALQTDASQTAIELLPLFAAVGPRLIPLSIFEVAWENSRDLPEEGSDTIEEGDLTPTTWHRLQLPSPCQMTGDSWDSEPLMEAVNLLRDFALISTTEDNGSTFVSLHPLVHAWARERQEPHEQAQAWLCMGCVTAISHRYYNLPHHEQRQLQPHLEALVDWPMELIFSSGPLLSTVTVVTRCGWLLHGLRADAKVFTLCKEVLLRSNLSQYKAEPRFFDLYDLTARSLSDHGNIREAVALLEQVVDIRERTLTPEHPSRLASQHTLASAYIDNGQVDKAVALLEQVVEIQKRTLTSEHPSRLASQHNLASAYCDNGQVDKAVALLEQVVEIRERTLTPEHPDRLVSQQTLAAYLWETGEKARAYRMVTHAVEVYQKGFEPTFPNRQKAEKWLERFQREMGLISSE